MDVEQKFQAGMFKPPELGGLPLLRDANVNTLAEAMYDAAVSASYCARVISYKPFDDLQRYQQQVFKQFARDFLSQRFELAAAEVEI